MEKKPFIITGQLKFFDLKTRIKKRLIWFGHKNRVPSKASAFILHYSAFTSQLFLAPLSLSPLTTTEFFPSINPQKARKSRRFENVDVGYGALSRTRCRERRLGTGFFTMLTHLLLLLFLSFFSICFTSQAAGELYFLLVLLFNPYTSLGASRSELGCENFGLLFAFIFNRFKYSINVCGFPFLWFGWVGI